MKKMVCGLLAIVMAFVLCSCGTNGSITNSGNINNTNSINHTDNSYSVQVTRPDGVTETFSAYEFSGKADANDYAFNNTYKGSTIELTDKVRFIDNQSNQWLLITTQNDYFFSIDVEDYPTQANQIAEGSTIRMTGRITQNASTKVNVECDTLEILD